MVMVAFLLLLLPATTLLLFSDSTRAFAPSNHARVAAINPGSPTSHAIGGAAALAAASSVADAAPPTAPPSFAAASDELVSALLARRRGAAPAGGEARISFLVDFLAAASVTFDPTLCLDGPLYASHRLRGPRPLWEALGLGGGLLQGQQYRYRGADGDGERRVANYAEVLGRDVHVRAYGTYARDDDGPAVAATGESEGGEGPDGPVEKLLKAFFGGARLLSGREQVTCPADFTVTVNEAAFFVLGNRFTIPISGTGYLRVLYADPKLRIFVSPISTTDDRWEKAGLTVAQIRVDLVTEGGLDFPDLFDE